LTTGSNTVEELTRLGKEIASLGPIIELINNRETIITSIKDLKQMESEEQGKNDENTNELLLLVRNERQDFEDQLQHLEKQLISKLTTTDEDDDKDIILEVRAGTGIIFLFLLLLVIYNYHLIYV
jgi:protein subunit release factor A